MESKFCPVTRTRSYHDDLRGGMLFYWEHISKTVLSLQLIWVIIMQALAVNAFVDEFSVYSSNKKWNRVLTRSSTINLPQNDNERASYWDNKYIAFDENRGVADILKRNTTIPLISLSMFGGLMVFNLLIILNQFFERNGQNRKRYLKCLAVSTWLSGALGIILLTLCTISMVVKHHYLTGSFGMAVMSLSRLVGVEQNHVPRELPQDNPISVKSNAVLFLQVFNSCRYGGVDHWNKLNELNGATHFEVPSYKQLIEMGLCVDERSYVPQIIQIVLAMMTLLNVFLFLFIIKLKKLTLYPPSISSRISYLENERGSMNNFYKMCEKL